MLPKDYNIRGRKLFAWYATKDKYYPGARRDSFFFL